jgi:polysaccharide pyruvyl transferase WcaK-like protein
MLGTLGERVTIRARDAVSRDRLSGHLGREVALTADIAFLLPPEVNSERARSAIRWIQGQREQGRVVVGVNINNHLVGAAGDLSPEILVGRYADALREMAGRHNVSFVMLPHDRRGKIDDWHLCEQLLGCLSASLVDLVYVPDREIRAAEIKGIVGETDCVVTGKMHVAVAALGRGVPAACVTYQDKFEGLMQHFGLHDVLLSGESACEPGALTEFFERLLARREGLRAEIATRLPEVTALSLGNVNFL